LLARGAAAGLSASPDGERPLPETPGDLFTLSDAALIGACVRCHGVDGAGRPSGAFPRLDIQSAAYLHRALQEYASGLRASGIMQPVAAALDESDVARLAGHYAAQAGEAPAVAAATERRILALGKQLATEGIPERQIAACGTCHGVEDRPENPLFPALAGQYSAFTALQLTLWKEGKRGGSSYSEIMEAAVGNMTPADIEAVSLYYESLPAAPSDPALRGRSVRRLSGTGPE
jgi:cytochrome c553